MCVGRKIEKEGEEEGKGERENAHYLVHCE